MRAHRFVLLAAALALAGCDRIASMTGAVDQKTLDAEAIGYACRISVKTPEDCMKENDTHSPTSILFGWKEAERDIKENAIDPSMGKNQPVPQVQQSVPPAAAPENKPAAAAAASAPAAAGKLAPAAAEKKADH